VVRDEGCDRLAADPTRDLVRERPVRTIVAHHPRGDEGAVLRAPAECLPGWVCGLQQSAHKLLVMIFVFVAITLGRQQRTKEWYPALWPHHALEIALP